jgi:hypothetical protein
MIVDISCCSVGLSDPGVPLEAALEVVIVVVEEDAGETKGWNFCDTSG